MGANENQRPFPGVFPLLSCEAGPVLSPSPGSVDFPPVAVSVDVNHHVLFEFTHPWVWYGSSLPRAKSRQKKSNQKMQRSAPEFTYTVKVNEVGALSHPRSSFKGRRLTQIKRFYCSGCSLTSQSPLVPRRIWRRIWSVTPTCVRGSSRWFLGGTDNA